MARPTTQGRVKKIVSGWLKSGRGPLQQALSSKVAAVEMFTDQQGEPIYFCVHLQPQGFIIVSGDDFVEPIIGFASDGVFDPSADNPLGALVTNDLYERAAAVRTKTYGANGSAMTRFQKAKAKWHLLETLDGGGVDTSSGTSQVSDVRIAPLLQSRWEQGYVCIQPCYNYYTPNHYYSGCVATSLAQLLRYHEYPVAGIGVRSFNIYVNDNKVTAYTRGGDGSGGPYNWGDMMFVPDCTTTEAQQQAIGALCCDAGIAMNTMYTPSFAATSLEKTRYALTNVFQYKNAVIGYNQSRDIGGPLYGMVNPNLDAKSPVLLGVAGPSDAHAIVCDGYGFDLSTPYHHLNMGWAGYCDAWYNLPNIDVSPAFTSVYCCIYNVRVSRSRNGEVISGRLLADDGTPLANVTVVAEPNGWTEQLTAKSDNAGIYALDDLASVTTYTISPQAQGYLFTPQQITTGISTDYGNVSGNTWGIDFHAKVFAVTQIEPAAGPSGSYIKIQGINFGNTPGSVLFAGSIASDEIVTWNDMLIYCRVPLGAASGNVVVKVFGCSSSSNMYFTVTNPNEVIVDAGNCVVNIENGTSEYPFSTIQKGIYAATTSRPVIVMPGTYIERISFTGKNIHITSANPNDSNCVLSTIISGGGIGPVVTFASGEDPNCILTGLTLTNGTADTGGGIYCRQSSPTIVGCVITNNAATSCGGGMYNTTSSHPTLRNCTFVANSASYGGAIANLQSSPRLYDCVLTTNEALYSGGAIHNEQSNPALVRCLFQDNSAADGGGAISSTNSSPILLNCRFRNNYTPDNRGGALHNTTSTGTIVNCLFTGNFAYEGASAIFNVESAQTIINCTIADNISDNPYAVLNSFREPGGHNTTLVNCIVWNNSFYEVGDFQTTSVITYSNIKGGWPGTGNINVNPAFVDDTNSDPNQRDYHLTADSPCIDAGSNAALIQDSFDLDADANTLEPIPLDIDNNPRFVRYPSSIAPKGEQEPMHPRVDMGADEFQYRGDLNFDGVVNLSDFVVFSNNWPGFNCGQCGGADLTGDGNALLDDFQLFCENWLAGK